MAKGSSCLWLLSVTILATLLGISQAKISESTIERDGRGIILLAEPFGFGADGHLDLTVSNLESHRSNVDTSLLGFFITSSQVRLLYCLASSGLYIVAAGSTCLLIYIQQQQILRLHSTLCTTM